MSKLMPYIMTLPLILLTSIMLIGLANALVQSLGYIPALGLNSISLNYYREIIMNPDLKDSLFLSLYICILSSALSVIVGVIICAALVYSGKSKTFLNYIIRLPILVPHTVVALFVVIILSQSGILARLFYAAGLIYLPSQFPNLIYNETGFGIILGYIWKQAPFVAYFTLALMTGISRTLEEAAINLGASLREAFFTITLPLSMPAILNALLIITAFSFGAYELPFLLGMTKPRALPVLAYAEYTHPDLTHRPYAMAMNGIIVIITLFISLLYFLLMHKKLGSLTDYDK